MKNTIFKENYTNIIQCIPNFFCSWDFKIYDKRKDKLVAIFWTKIKDLRSVKT